MAQIIAPTKPWNDYKLKELKPFLKDRGLRRTGNKPALVKRLEDYDAQIARDNANEQQPDEGISFSEYINKINADIGEVCIDNEQADHLNEQDVTAECFEDMIQNGDTTLVSTFGISIGKCFKIKKLLLPTKTKCKSEEKNSDHGSIPKDGNDTKQVSVDKQFEYASQARFMITTAKKKNDIQSQKIRKKIEQSTQSVGYSEAKKLKGAAAIMKEQVIDLDANGIITITENDLSFAGNGGTRKWTCVYNINAPSETYSALNDEQQTGYKEYIAQKKLDIRNIATKVFGSAELQSCQELGLLNLWS